LILIAQNQAIDLNNRRRFLKITDWPNYARHEPVSLF